MADKPQPHIHRISKGHKLASKMKTGQVLTAKLKMLDPDEATEGDEGTYPMQEVSSAIDQEQPVTRAGVQPPIGSKSPIEALKARRRGK